MSTFLTRRLGLSLEWLLVLAILVISFRSAAETVSFHGDESQWIATSAYSEPFVRGDFSSPLWRESYWTLTQPPITRYIIGIARRAGGYRTTELNKPWNFGVDARANLAAGNMPSPGLLGWSRAIMGLLAVLSGMLLFKLVRRSAGNIAAYIFLLMFAGSPYMLLHLNRAMSESPLLFFTLLSIFASNHAVESFQRTSKASATFKAYLSPLLWFALMGLFCGAASATKLNGATALLGGCVLVVLAAWRTQRTGRGQRLLVIAAIVVMIFAAALFFVLCNPYLYPDPIGRSLKLLDWRLSEMQSQQASNPNWQIPGLQERLTIIPMRIFQMHAFMSFEGAGIANVFFFLVGMGYLVYATMRWLYRDDASATSAAILAIGLAVSIPPLFTPLNWDRYYLFPIVFTSVCIAIGIATTITATIRGGRRMLFRYIAQGVV